jgi:hypothetical protein
VAPAVAVQFEFQSPRGHGPAVLFRRLVIPLQAMPGASRLAWVAAAHVKTRNRGHRRLRLLCSDVEAQPCEENCFRAARLRLQYDVGMRYKW